MIRQAMLRSAKPADMADMQELLEDAKQQMRSAGVQQWTIAYPSKMNILTDIQTTQLLVLGDPICSAVTLVRQSDKWAFKRLMVHSRVRGHGIATSILSELITLGQSQGIQHFEISTHNSNAAMIHLIKSLQFKEQNRYRAIDREQLGDFIRFIRLTAIG